MEYLLSITDGAHQHMAVLSLTDQIVRSNAIEIVLDIIGGEDLNALVSKNILAESYIDDLKALQQLVFDHDDQGQFIREDVFFTANGSDLNPDAPLVEAFIDAEQNGVKYKRCDLLVLSNAGGGSSTGNTNANDKEFALAFFLHQISVGCNLDVTKEYPELMDVLAQAEKEQLVEIDVKTANYRLTERGKKIHDTYMDEAQDLIKRFDIFGDVDVDSQGTARFDTGLGRDLRVPIYEIEGVDPFRARFLLGLNDGEWDKSENWIQMTADPKWYAKIMDPVERAPSVDELGRNRLQIIIDQGKAELRRTNSQLS